MSPDPGFWDQLTSSVAPSETRADETCQCREIVSATQTLLMLAISATLRGDDARSQRLEAEADELYAIVVNHAKGLVSSEALLDWKHAREEQARSAS